MSIDKALFREVMGQFATGVTIVTGRLDEQCHGMTANAFTSVSLDPTLVLVCVNREARTHQFIADAGAFAVNILAEAQQHLAELFSRRWDGTDRFAAVDHHHGPSGSPIIDGCLAYLDCHLVAAYPSGDHTIYVGEVVEADISRDGRPLLYYDRGYRHMSLAAAER